MKNLNFDELRKVGDENYQRGLYKEAIAFYDQILVLNPSDIEALRRKAKALLSLDDDEAALFCYEKIIAVEPHQSWPYLYKGDILDWMEHYNEALECYEHASSLEPSNSIIWIKKGRTLRNLTRFEEALSCYDQALYLNSNDSQIWSGKGDVLLELKNYLEAFNCYEKAENCPGSVFKAPDWLSRGDTLYVSDQIEYAMFCYDKSIASDSNYFWAWRGKGLVLMSQQKYEDALKCFEKALEIDSKSATALIDKGNALFAQQNYSEAALCYDKALEIDPMNFFALANKGAVYQNLTQFEEAIQWYDKAIEIDNKDSDLWYRKGNCLDQLQKIDDAIKCYDTAIDLTPESLWSWNDKGYDFALKVMHEDALMMFDKAIEINKSEFLPWINKSRSLRDLGKVDAALQCLESALQVVTSPINVLIELGGLAGDYIYDNEKSLEYYGKALKIDPNESLIKVNIAEALITLGRYLEGRTYADEVIHNIKNKKLLCIAQYLLMISYVFEGEFKTDEFQKFIEYFISFNKENGNNVVWNYQSLSKVITKSNIALEMKFLLLTLIDLQLGKIDAAKLSFFERMIEEQKGFESKFYVLPLLKQTINSLKSIWDKNAMGAKRLRVPQQKPNLDLN